jgi:hypothetical protein
MFDFDTRNDWIYKVRNDINEKTKNMSSEEYLAYFRKSSQELAKKYGFELVESADSPREPKSPPK